MKRYIIPIFIPHQGCPHHCVFCNQRAISGQQQPPGAAAVAGIIREQIERVTRPRLVEVAFYGGSFTCLPAVEQVELLAPAKALLDAGLIGAVRVSTRPDAIDEAGVKRLTAYGVSTVELGAQSLDDAVLRAAGRGHTAADVGKAVDLIKAAGIVCGLQLMLGLPDEDWPSLISSVRAVRALAPDFARLYPAVVLAGTELAARWQAGLYVPLTMEVAVARTAYAKLSLENAGIPVIRTGLQATDELAGDAVLAGPYHPAFGAMVDAFIFRQMVLRLLEKLNISNSEKILLRHHPQDDSALRGLANANKIAIFRRYPTIDLAFSPTGTERGEIILRHRQTNYVVNKAMLTLD